MILPHELPQAIRAQSEEVTSIEQTQTQNSTDLDFHHNKESDPLLEFLKKRKQLRFQFEHRYSRKAIGMTAYLRQKDSPYSPKMYNGILINYQPD